MKLHPHETRVLKVLGDRSTPEDIARKSKLEKDAVMRALAWLSTKSLVKIEEEIIEEITLGREGETYCEKGLPERQIIDLIGDGGGIGDLQGRLSREEITIGLGWLKKKELGTLKKGRITVVKKDITADEKLLKLIEEKGTVCSSDLDPELMDGLELLKRRKAVIRIVEKKRIYATPTGEGLEVGKSSQVDESISQLTPGMLASGKWRDMKFRPYDTGVYVKPEFPAKRHPLQRLIDRIRDIFVGMGFREINGPLVESAFWNFDALFQPQDHPARDMHDTFYLKNPRKVAIPGFRKYKDKIKKTHEDGWTTGSTGWQYMWDPEVAKKTLLRTHTTSVTCRHLTSLGREDLPVRVFSIGKVFRNEAIDYKHLPEFYQVEGIIVDENVNFRNLLGILAEFYDEMGFTVRFRPAYFPYTEMSVEPEVFIEGKGEWVELGGAGIFRPEVVKPLLGFDCPVLAWGLGLDRTAALNLGLSDIRDLYLSDLSWLRSRSVL